MIYRKARVAGTNRVNSPFTECRISPVSPGVTPSAHPQPGILSPTRCGTAWNPVRCGHPRHLWLSSVLDLVPPRGDVAAAMSGPRPMKPAGQVFKLTGGTRLTSPTIFADAIEIQKRLINVLVMSSDSLRRDLLESGISSSVSVGNVSSGEIHEDDGANSIPPQIDVDVAVIDLTRAAAVEYGLKIARELKSRSINTAIVVLAGSQAVLADVRNLVTDVGPKWSFLTTDLISGLDDLVRIIDSAATGMTIVDPGFFTDVRNSDRQDAVLTRPLTSRQVQVLDLVSQGYSNEVIGKRLDISLRTVEHHLNETYVAIKNCRSVGINARVYAAKIFSECIR